MSTLQHAFTRGLELVFQLEEGETLTEPTPSRENRKAILAFEATEGGAGVLSRLLSEPMRLAEVARATLELMHYQNIDTAISNGDPDKLTDTLEAECVKGCYRCLLSYYNQPDHELIDRTDADVRRILLRLARGEVSPVKQPSVARLSEWPKAFAAWGLPAPDSASLTVGEVTLPFAWRAHLTAATVEPPATEIATAVEALGFSLVYLPARPGSAPPSDLVALLGVEA
jgi:hypothetical protein